ncbi:hypothetical protein AQV86_05860 [Nanohaloarchaea archaeon SG9]|nr:hypothetical protein AQV86_05860 [Nanohaloarchaea archaeon SG9]PSH00446.1 MAG: hypothetical protein BRC30_03490 [Nanohaloarchaea archaeon SW_7_46_7]
MDLQLLILGLTGGGLLALFYGFFTAFEFRNTLGKGKLAEAWDKLIGMIALFILGYIAFAAQIISSKQFLDPKLISALIFFAGAIFVAAVAKLNYDVYKV